MKALSIARRLWTTPLSRMTYDGAGTMNIPVEIWEEIFTFAAALVVQPAFIEDELQRDPSLDPHLFNGTPTIISNLHELQRLGLFSLRRSIVLVCKAWYFIGISALQAHVCVDFGQSVERMQSLNEALAENHNFSSSVIRISIKGSEDYRSDGSWRTSTDDRKKDQILKRISARIPCVQIVSIPHYLQRHVYAYLDPAVVVVTANPWNSLEAFDTRLVHGDQFWHRSRTLSPSFPPLHQYKSAIPLGTTRGSPIFLNLVNLKLPPVDNSIYQWIINDWEIPYLKSLSLTTMHPARWVNFIKRYSLTLETLEIAPHNEFVSLDYEDPPSSPMHMPQLASLSTYVGYHAYIDNSPHSWVNCVMAPNLRHLTFYIQRGISWETWSLELSRKVSSIVETYPTATTIRLCYEKEVYPRYIHAEDYFPFIPMSLVIELCECGLTVEVMEMGSRYKEVFSEVTAEMLMTKEAENNLHSVELLSYEERAEWAESNKHVHSVSAE